MDIVYSMGSGTAREVMDRMQSPPSYASVRSTLRWLVEKGQLTYERSGKKFVYKPTAQTEQAAESALRQILSTFYQGSTAAAVSGLLGMNGNKLTKDELRRIEQMIEKVEETK
jgi:BlaI family penicillinase repressor